MARKWTKERVIETLQARHEEGLPLETIKRKHRALYAAARRLFGNWRAAQKAAGIDCWGSKWTKQVVIDGIQARHRQGLPLNTVWREYRPLCDAAKKFFGNWRNAVRAVGLEYWHRDWTKEEVVEEILARHRQGRRMMGIGKEDPSLYEAACKYWGGWRKAMLAVGLEPVSYWKWTEERVIEAIRARHQEGHPIRSAFRDDKLLYAAAFARFGSWRNAVLAAGLRPRPRKKWTKRRVIMGLQSLYQTSGAEHPKRDIYLDANAVRLFGTIDSAMRAAGLDPIRKNWSEQRVIEAIQNRYVKGLSLSDKCRCRALIPAAKQLFGSWPNALQAAGIPRRRRRRRGARRKALKPRAAACRSKR